ncbi:MAG: electron transport complex subunit RsxB [Alphaproteobacteria bacterium]|nr:electron transport complex subunit RsxB [Rhodospirillales bacterium]MCW9046375.1 electron transport complex subunit RsxB [Alphaproteobacteria bacterium]
MLTAIGSLTLLGLVLGGLLGIASKYLKVEGNPLVIEVEEMLPGSQCGQCGFPGCGPAAEALADGKADVTLCPPGGRALAADLAKKLSVEVDLTSMEEKEPAVAFVNEDLCIGCTRCFAQCPTDAFIGAPKQIHTVIGEICTSCEKCIDICPTECITMQPLEATVQTWHWPKPKERRLAA